MICAIVCVCIVIIQNFIASLASYWYSIMTGTYNVISLLCIHDYSIFFDNSPNESTFAIPYGLTNTLMGNNFRVPSWLKLIDSPFMWHQYWTLESKLIVDAVSNNSQDSGIVTFDLELVIVTFSITGQFVLVFPSDTHFSHQVCVDTSPLMSGINDFLSISTYVIDILLCLGVCWSCLLLRLILLYLSSTLNTDAGSVGYLFSPSVREFPKSFHNCTYFLWSSDIKKTIPLFMSCASFFYCSDAVLVSSSPWSSSIFVSRSWVMFIKDWKHL